MKEILLLFYKVKNILLGFLLKSVFVGQYTTNRNYGDALNLLLLRKLLHPKRYVIIPQRYIFEWYYKKKVNLQFIGSVIAEADNNSIVWGAGAISKEVRLNEKPKKILAVRGPLTRNLLIEQGVDCPEVYGDPALLLPRFYKPNINPKYKIGFIPHYIDQGKSIVRKIKQDNRIHYIDILLSRSKLRQAIYKEWTYLIDEICSCQVIVSSSLHGLVIADAYKKPTLWVKFGDDVLGNDFKFYDYYASMGISSNDINPLEVLSDNISIDDFYNNARLKPVEKVDMDLFLKQNPF